MKSKDRFKVAIGSLPSWISQPLGKFCERTGLAGSHFHLWRRLGFPQVILAGPFAGMKYLPTAAGSAIIPKFLGSYEIELSDTIAHLSTIGIDGVIDIGAADGYYAVGLGRLMKVPVLTFDTDPYSRVILAKIARLNGLDQSINIQGYCNHEDLEVALGQFDKPLLVVDCEGFEDRLLSLDDVPLLEKAWVIVECHDFLVDGVANRLRTRFEPTHRIAELKMRHRSPEQYAAKYALSSAEAAFAIDEGRPQGMVWLTMFPKGDNAIPAGLRSNGIEKALDRSGVQTHVDNNSEINGNE